MGRFFYWLAHFIWHKLGSWKVVSHIPKGLKKAVISVAPHTANEDFPVGLGAWHTQNLKANFIAKKELFDGPMGFIFKATGGIPIDRSKSQNMVEQAAGFFKNREELFLVIAPEGTRGPRERWKTGFYHIAKTAGVPIVLAYIDFAKKEVGIGEVFHPTENQQADLLHIENFYRGISAKIPANYNPKLT